MFQNHGFHNCTRILRRTAFLASTSAVIVMGQGPAPETAPPLFPGAGLISYVSSFTTRELMPRFVAGTIPVTSHATFFP